MNRLRVKKDDIIRQSISEPAAAVCPAFPLRIGVLPTGGLMNLLSDWRLLNHRSAESAESHALDRSAQAR